MSHHFLKALAFFIGAISTFSHAQNLATGELHGNFQADAQYYRLDSLIGAPIVPEKVLSNGFLNLTYVKGNFNAGVRYENFLNPLQGFDPRWKGQGFLFRFATFNTDGLEVTAGSFYEQFGSGLVLRAYEERGLGFDSFLDGIRVRYAPYKGIYIKGLIAKQRSFFAIGPGLVRGADGEFQLNEMFDWNESIPKVMIGGAIVSRFQTDLDAIYNLPENVSSSSARMRVIWKKWNFNAEYAFKINDPNATNGFIYRPGDALLVNAIYSKKGLGLVLSAKRLNNMDFRSDRNASGNNLNINFLPALTRQHTFNLPATIYPYATQPNGEMAFQAELTYNIKKGTKLGGKYGTDVVINLSNAYSIQKTPAANDTFGYNSKFFAVGNTPYFHDYHIEIRRKINSKWKATAMYLNWLYNKDVVQGLSGYGTIYANMFVLDAAYKIKSNHTIRAEVQGLFSKQDEGSWAMAMIEYTFAPHWYIAVMDQYNYGNPSESRQIHYVNFNAGYIKDGNRIMLGYGRQRAGIFCVGGVCRNVPASNGLSITIMSSF
jgi:hypothetical protein